MTVERPMKKHLDVLEMSHITSCVLILGFLSLFHSLAMCQECQPLHLTPYLDQGQITRARDLSLVSDESGVIPTSYAGFITVDKSLRNHLFFWFFPALSGNQSAPLLVWLNGGPGVSSMFGLFHENGPLKLRKISKRCQLNWGSKASEDCKPYERRIGSWAERFSMLYIDNPVGVGFSYSESGVKGYRSNQTEYAKDLFEFIKQFYKIFPEYLRRELYIGGQSYAGKYVPSFAYEIHKENQAGKSIIPLNGIYLGGPFIEPVVQDLRYSDLYYVLGYISFRQKKEFDTKVKTMYRDLISRRQTFNLDAYYNTINLGVCQGCWDNWATLEIPPHVEVDEVMPTLKTLVHACNSYYSYERIKEVRSKMSQEYLTPTKLKLGRLMDNYKVLIYTGDQDGAITSPMVEATLMSTSWSRQSEYNNARREVWTLRGQVAGFYSRVGRFCRVTVRGAGHQTPYDQPVTTLVMMTQFVNNGCVENI